MHLDSVRAQQIRRLHRVVRRDLLVLCVLGPEPGGVVLHHHLIVATGDSIVFVLHAR